MLKLYNDEIPKFGSNLIEEKCYYIKNIRVKKRQVDFNVVSHEYQLTLARDVMIVEVEKPSSDIPFYTYYFTSFNLMSTLLNKTVNGMVFITIVIVKIVSKFIIYIPNILIL